MTDLNLPRPGEARDAYVRRAHAHLNARLLEWEAEWRLTSLEYQGVLLRAAPERNAGLVNTERAGPVDRGPPVVPRKIDHPET